MRGRALAVLGAFTAAACGSGSEPPARSAGWQRGVFNDSAAAAFGDTVAAMLLDTDLFELRGNLWMKVRNPNRDDESPLADREIAHPRPPVLIHGHRHGDDLYVPVKLFARQYGAFVDVTCTLANCGSIWTPDILRFMADSGPSGSTGMVEAHAEGLVRGLDVRKLPSGG